MAIVRTDADRFSEASRFRTLPITRTQRAICLAKRRNRPPPQYSYSHLVFRDMPMCAITRGNTYVGVLTPSFMYKSPALMTPDCYLSRRSILTRLALVCCFTEAVLERGGTQTGIAYRFNWRPRRDTGIISKVRSSS